MLPPFCHWENPFEVDFMTQRASSHVLFAASSRWCTYCYEYILFSALSIRRLLLGPCVLCTRSIDESLGTMLLFQWLWISSASRCTQCRAHTTRLPDAQSTEHRLCGFQTDSSVQSTHYTASRGTQYRAYTRPKCAMRRELGKSGSETQQFYKKLTNLCSSSVVIRSIGDLSHSLLSHFCQGLVHVVSSMIQRLGSYCLWSRNQCGQVWNWVSLDGSCWSLVAEGWHWISKYCYISQKYPSWILFQ